MKILFFTLFLFVSLAVFADPWDNLTKQEAKKVVQFLKQNPYVLDYCDCCDIESVALVKVTSVKIIDCEWKKGQYSIEVETRKVVDIPNTDTGPQLPDAAPAYGNHKFLVTMNYTWGFNATTKKAAPLFDMIEYKTYGDDRKPCKSYTEYPNPYEAECDIFDREYREWYKLNVIY